MRHEWDSFALSLRDEGARATIKQNCVLFLPSCQSFRCPQCLRDRKFNETSNECRDCESCPSSFVFFTIFFDQASMTWRKPPSTMFNCRNKLYKFCCAHRSLFRNNWLTFRRSWLNFSARRDAWALCLRPSNVFFCFNWNSPPRPWHPHFFYFHPNKLSIENLTCHCHELTMLLSCQSQWLLSKNSLTARRYKIDWALSSFFSNVFAFIVFLLAMKSFVTLTFVFFSTSNLFEYAASLFRLRWSNVLHSY